MTRPVFSLTPKGVLRRLMLFGLCALIALPILSVLGSLISADGSHWARMWGTTLPIYIGNSVLLMILTGVFATIVGTGAAWCVSMLDFPGRRILSWALILPLAAPAYIVGYIYVDLLDFYGPVQSGLRSLFDWTESDYSFPPIRTLPAAAFILGIVLYPYIYLLARTAFLEQSYSQWLAARSLGLSPFQTFRRISLPAARPAIIGGLSLVLMEVLADFGVADYFGIPTFSTGIFRNWLAAGDRPAAMSLAAVMLLFVFILIVLENRSRKGRVTTQGTSQRQAGRLPLSKKRGALVAALCALPVLFGFVIPALALSANILTQVDGQAGETFLTYTWNTVKLATIVGVISLLIAIFLSYYERNEPSRFGRAAIKLSTLGYALPGALLAVGLLYPLGGVDRGLTRWASSELGWDQGLILSGTIVILAYALTVRYLTVAFNSVSSGFEKIPFSMDAAGRTLGLSPVRLVGRVHLPLLRSSLSAGLILVFIDVLRELPATLILRPFNFETLATRVYWLASDERLIEASSAALLIIVIGLIPVIWLNRAPDRYADR